MNIIDTFKRYNMKKIDDFNMYICTVRLNLQTTVILLFWRLLSSYSRDKHDIEF